MLTQIIESPQGEAQIEVRDAFEVDETDAFPLADVRQGHEPDGHRERDGRGENACEPVGIVLFQVADDLVALFAGESLQHDPAAARRLWRFAHALRGKQLVPVDGFFFLGIPDVSEKMNVHVAAAFKALYGHGHGISPVDGQGTLGRDEIDFHSWPPAIFVSPM